MAPTLGNTALEKVRVGRYVSLAPYFIEGDSEARSGDLSHSEFFVAF